MGEGQRVGGDDNQRAGPHTHPPSPRTPPPYYPLLRTCACSVSLTKVIISSRPFLS